MFTGMGAPFAGHLMDLSTTGAKIQLLGDLTDKLDPAQIIDDCQLIMPNGDLLDLCAQVRGLTYDSERSLSVVRCEFINLSGNDVVQLQGLLDQASHKPRGAELALVS